MDWESDYCESLPVHVSEFQPISATRNHSLHGDYLFSYRPNPGTVLFFGYGSAADGLPDPSQRFNWQPLRRTSDYFLVKYGYLFRM